MNGDARTAEPRAGVMKIAFRAVISRIASRKVARQLNQPSAENPQELPSDNGG
jgi:hypothetical protein